MSIDGLSGASGAMGPQVGAPSALRRVLELGWIEGRVTALLGEGEARISTALGPLTVTLAALQPMPGDRLRLRIDPQTGQLRIETLAPHDPPAALPAAGAGAMAGAGRAVQEGAAFLPSAVLAGLQPLLPGGGGQAGPPMPQADVALYSLLAALFPAAVADGRLRRPDRRRPNAYRPDPGPEAPPPEVAPEPPDSAGTEPDLTLADAPETLVWLEVPPEVPPAAQPDAGGPAPRPVAGEPTEDFPGSRAAIEIGIAGTGRVRLQAHLGGGRVSFEVTSEGELPPALVERIRARARSLAESWDAPLDLRWTGAGGAGADGPAAQP